MREDQNKPIRISVIIVNYNVKDFLEQALHSVRRALQDIPSEIIVVDNASIDGSVPMIRQRFPDITLIESPENTGFSAGNNLGLKEARGSFIVLLNPDTVVQEDTFSRLLNFFEEEPRASAATCKILNPDGTFSVDCRHSVPTPLTAFWKLIGLNRLFPKSKTFGRYNLTYMDENEINRVEAISGSFMMIRRETIEKVGLLDEEFFMYCEDIDYCHRINLAGGEIYYVPTSQIIHYKGESTKKNNLDYIITFNRSLYQFYKKHYQQKYIYPFKWLIFLGVIVRGFMVFMRNTLSRYYPFLLDLLILNVVLFFTFWIRMALKDGFSLSDFFSQHIVVNGITSLSYFVSSLFFDTLNRDRFSILKTIKANFSTYLFVAALTFFLKQFAFSRLVVVVAALLNTTAMIGWRVAIRLYSRKASTTISHDLFRKRTLVVGYDQETENLLIKLQHWFESGMKISGIVAMQRSQIGQELAGVPVVTSIDKLAEYLRLRKIDLVVFMTHNISYETILATMSSVQSQNIEFKMVPGHLEYMISKSNVERFESVPLVDIEYAYGRPFNRFVKRAMDVIGALLVLVPLSPVFLISALFGYRHITRRDIRSGSRFSQSILWSEKRGVLRVLVLFLELLRGNISLVGAPLETEQEHGQLHVDYKPGLTGMVQVRDSGRQSFVDTEKLELYYLKNHSIWLDLEILFRAVFGSKK